MAENGRVVIPAALRAVLGINDQRAEVFFEIRGKDITLTTRLRN